MFPSFSNKISSFFKTVKIIEFSFTASELKGVLESCSHDLDLKMLSFDSIEFQSNSVLSTSISSKLLGTWWSMFDTFSSSFWSSTVLSMNCLFSSNSDCLGSVLAGGT